MLPLWCEFELKLFFLFEKIQFPLESIPLDAVNILSHGMNSGIMLLDILIVAYPLRLYHVIQPICFGVSYGIFSFIYYLCDGVDMYVDID